MKRKVAISACLLGEKCRYDASDNKSEALLKALEHDTLVPFCPEDFAFGSPRPTMDLVGIQGNYAALSNTTRENLSSPILAYAKDFFDTHPDIELFIGKDRSPSCGVCSARLYDKDKNLLSSNQAGLMAGEALKRGIVSVDAEGYIF